MPPCAEAMSQVATAILRLYLPSETPDIVPCVDDVDGESVIHDMGVSTRGVINQIVYEAFCGHARPRFWALELSNIDELGIEYPEPSAETFDRLYETIDINQHIADGGTDVADASLDVFRDVMQIQAFPPRYNNTIAALIAISVLARGEHPCLQRRNKLNTIFLLPSIPPAFLASNTRTALWWRSLIRDD